MHPDEILKEIKSDIKEIKGHLIDLIKQGAVSNQTLIEHERRSTNLETRFEPIEKDVYLARRLAVFFTSSGMIGLIATLIHHLTK